MIKTLLLILGIGLLLMIGLGFYLYCRKITLGEQVFMVLADLDQMDNDEYQAMLDGDGLVDYLVRRFDITEEQARSCIFNRHNRDFFDEQTWLTVEYGNYRS